MSVYNDGQHFIPAFAAFQEMREKHELCDVILIVDNNNIYAHKLILSACIPFFRPMFNNANFSESSSNEIKLECARYEILSAIIDFIYTGEIVITDENIQELISLANMLQLFQLRDAWSEYLQNKLDPSNCLGIELFAECYNCEKLFRHALRYIELNFTKIIGCDEFLNLTVERLTKLISNEYLNTDSEKIIFESVLLWLKHDLEIRPVHFLDLLKHIRLTLMTEEYILDKFTSMISITDEAEFKRYIFEIFRYRNLQLKEYPNMAKTTPRQGAGQVLMIIGGRDDNQSLLENVEIFDFETQTIQDITNLPTPRTHAGCAILNGNIFVVGGFVTTDNNNYHIPTLPRHLTTTTTSIVEMYDANMDKWITFPPMPSPRGKLSVITLDNKLYAIGGNMNTDLDDVEINNTVEVFDPVTNEWTTVPPIPQNRDLYGVGTLDNCLYLVGGYNEWRILNSVDVYKPTEQQWSSAANMLVKRSSATVIAFGGKLYVIGGFGDMELRLNSVECYDPVKNSWTMLASMTEPRSFANVVEYRGQLIVFGGINERRMTVTSVEAYDPKTDTWSFFSEHSRLLTNRYGACFTMIHKPVCKYAAHGGLCPIAHLKQNSNSNQSCSSISCSRCDSPDFLSPHPIAFL